MANDRVMRDISKRFAKLETFTPEAVVAEMDNRRLDRWRTESERHIAFLNNLIQAMMDRRSASEEEGTR